MKYNFSLLFIAMLIQSIITIDKEVETVFDSLVMRPVVPVANVYME
jgi:hypothetical protein